MSGPLLPKQFAQAPTQAVAQHRQTVSHEHEQHDNQDESEFGEAGHANKSRVADRRGSDVEAELDGVAADRAVVVLHQAGVVLEQDLDHRADDAHAPKMRG